MRSSSILLLCGFLALSGCFEGKTAPFKHLLVGFNAPATRDTNVYFRGPDEARSSWLASTLSPEQLSRVLSQVDFEQQVLVLVVDIERSAATGRVDVQRVKVEDGALIPVLRIGVNEENCTQKEHASRPFVLIAVEWPKESRITAGGSFHQSVLDGCKPVVSATTLAKEN